MKQPIKGSIFFVIMLVTLVSCVNEDQNVIQDFYVYPNPYSAQGSGNATFRLILKQTVTNAPVSISITDQSHQLVWEFSQISNGGTATPIDIIWGGENNSGISLAPGVYYVKVSVGGAFTGEKLIEMMIL